MRNTSSTTAAVEQPLTLNAALSLYSQHTYIKNEAFVETAAVD